MGWKNALSAIVFYILQIKVFQECLVKIVKTNSMFHALENGLRLVIRVIVLFAKLISFD
jgi:hypothetical protein